MKIHSWILRINSTTLQQPQPACDMQVCDWLFFWGGDWLSPRRKKVSWLSSRSTRSHSAQLTLSSTQLSSSLAQLHAQPDLVQFSSRSAQPSSVHLWLSSCSTRSCPAQLTLSSTQLSSRFAQLTLNLILSSSAHAKLNPAQITMWLSSHSTRSFPVPALCQKIFGCVICRHSPPPGQK